jgi:hypothetical protein
MIIRCYICIIISSVIITYSIINKNKEMQLLKDIIYNKNKEMQLLKDIIYNKNKEIEKLNNLIKIDYDL